MCQSRLQESIGSRLLSRGASDYDYSDEDQSSHRDTVMLSFYMEIADCDIFQDYINETLKQNCKYKHEYTVKEALIIDALYEAFDIELTSIINFDKLIKDNK